jgi:hypothetical protein
MSSFLIYAFRAINFSLATVLFASHRLLCYVVDSFLQAAMTKYNMLDGL